MATFTKKIIANGYHALKFTNMHLRLSKPTNRVSRIIYMMDNSEQFNLIPILTDTFFSQGTYHARVGRLRDTFATARIAPLNDRIYYEKCLIKILHGMIFTKDAKIPFSVIMRLFLTGINSSNKSLLELNELQLIRLFLKKKYKKIILVSIYLKPRYTSSFIIPLIEHLTLHQLYIKGDISLSYLKDNVRGLSVEDFSFRNVPSIITAETLHLLLSLFEERDLSNLTLDASQLMSSRKASIRRALKLCVKQEPLLASKLILKMRPINRWSIFLIDCARELMNNWQLPDALKVCNQALDLIPTNSALYAIKASVLWDLGRTEDALASAKCAVALEPYNNEADELFELLNGTTSELSIENLRTSILAAANPIKAATSGAVVLVRRRRSAEAEKLLLEFLADPHLNKQQRGVIIRSLGGVYERAERFQDASLCYKRLIKQKRYIASAHIGVARCMLELNDLTIADQNVESALKAGFGDNKFDVTIMNLRLAQGRLYEGLRDYRSRKFSTSLRRQFGPKYISEGQKIYDFETHSKILLIMEHGPGDETRIASFYPELQKRFKNLTATCEPRLFSLFERNFPLINFLPVTRSRKEFRQNDYVSKSLVCSSQIARFVNNDVIRAAKDVDLVCSIYDLQCELRPNALAFPRVSKIIDPLPELQDYWKNFILNKSGNTSRFRVAINWRSMLQNFARDRNYFQISEFSVLADLKDVEFWAFQPTMTDIEFDELQSILPNVYKPSGLDLRDDFEGMAAFLANMDVCIAPTTSNAELSAAVGTPTLILSNVRNTSWRRNQDGSDMWHGSARIIIGSPLGNRQSQMISLLDEIKHIMNLARKAA